MNKSNYIAYEYTVKTNTLKEHCIGYYSGSTNKVHPFYPWIKNLPSRYDGSEYRYHKHDIFPVVNLEGEIIGHANNFVVKKVSQTEDPSDYYLTADITQTQEKYFFETSVCGNKLPSLLMAFDPIAESIVVVFLGYLNKHSFDRFLNFGAARIEAMLRQLRKPEYVPEYFSLWTKGYKQKPKVENASDPAYLQYHNPAFKPGESVILDSDLQVVTIDELK